MRGLRVRMAAAAIVTVALGCTEAVAGWDSYVPRTIRSVIEANQGQIAPEATHVFTASNFPTRATVTYQGKVRAISSERLDFLRAYLGKVRQHPEWADLYSEEVLCREGDVDYWLPIQSSVLTYFKTEVAAGAPVELFVTWIGVQKAGEQLDWIFTVNEFETVNGHAK